MKDGWKYRAGDLLAGAIIGAKVALAHHFPVPESLGMAAGALLGMFVGRGAQMLISVPLGSFLGSVEVMAPGMFVGMLAMVPPPFRLHSLQAEIYLGAGIGCQPKRRCCAERQNQNCDLSPGRHSFSFRSSLASHSGHSPERWLPLGTRVKAQAARVRARPLRYTEASLLLQFRQLHDSPGRIAAVGSRRLGLVPPAKP